MKYLFTGTGRCGTRQLAMVLTSAGFPTGHELLFQPFRTIDPWETNSVVSEASWCALEFPELWPKYTVHLVRDPRAVWRSLEGIRFFDASYANASRSWYRAAAARIEPTATSATTWIQSVHSKLANHPRVYIDRGAPLAEQIAAATDLRFDHLPTRKTRTNSREPPTISHCPRASNN
jgi:hypothetical protein